MDLRSTARDLFSEALGACSIEQALDSCVAFTSAGFCCGREPYDWSQVRETMIVAIGKAAAPMARAFIERAGPSTPLRAIVVGPREFEDLPAGCRYFRGGHPRPDAGSLQAAGAIVTALRGRGDRDLVVFLVSGGASAMVERLLDESIPLADIAATHRALVESGATIAAINTVRKHLSALKGGRLARLAAPARQLSLFASDVPPGQLDALASGPTVPDPTTVADARAVIASYGLASRIPPRVLAILDRADAESVKPGDAAFARSAWQVLIDSEQLGAAAARTAADRGWKVVVDNACDDGPAEKAADHLLKRLGEERARHPRVCLVSAGEVTVQLPATAGRGGRNQHFALLCAERIAGKNIAVLSAGSDGVDGNSDAAGAVADGSTLERARALGLDPAGALERFDSASIFAQLGDAIVTGPTGNNLRDLRILLSETAQ